LILLPVIEKKKKKKIQLTLSLRSTQALLTTVILSLMIGSSGSYGYNIQGKDYIIMIMIIITFLVMPSDVQSCHILKLALSAPHGCITNIPTLPHEIPNKNTSYK